jgi:photosystem II stability/assembly factor-like uncharacterized protein
VRNLIKFSSIIFVSFLFSFPLLNAQWEECNNGLGTRTIYCFLVDGNNIYAGTDAGVYMSSDNGDNWIDKNIGLKELYGQGNFGVYSLAIIGHNIFAGTALHGIFLSTDKGDNWERKSNGLPYILNGQDTLFRFFVNALTINGNNIFAGTDIGVYLSTDNGGTWNLKNYGLPQLDTFKTKYRDVWSFAIIGNNIFAGTRSGVYQSTDNGDSWFSKNKGIENWAVFSLAINGNNIYAGVDYEGVFQSTNNGENWKYIGLKDTTISALITKGNYIFAAGHGVDISTNNGKNWIVKKSGLTCFGTGSLIINGDYIFAGDAICGIFRAKLSDLGITAVKEAEQKNVCIIYPNPANTSFRLKYNSEVETQVQLSIYDCLGNEVLNLTENCVVGTNEKTIDCSRLSTGYYFVKVRCGADVQTQGLVIIK